MKNTHKQIFAELNQDTQTRAPLYKEIEEQLDGRALVSFFTSFAHPVSISDDDCDMLQSILQHTDTSNGLVLLVNSPGGDGLAAERIVNACRSYSGTDDYWVLVAGKAKSAATIISMGASKIMMPPTAELGPVDPQIIMNENGRMRSFSAHSLVDGYDGLFKEAVQTEGRLEPFLQQLSYYDDRDINTYRSIIQLSEDIAVKLLHSGMMASSDPDQIRDKIDIFLTPDAGTLSHGRPIYAQEARDCGLMVEDIDVSSDFWKKIYQLYVRLEMFVSLSACKICECKEDSFHVPIPR